MKDYCPQIAASFEAKPQAERALHALIEGGVPPETVQLVEPHVTARGRRLVRDLCLGALGGAATGAVLAALLQLGLLAAFPALLEAGAWLTLPAALLFGGVLGAIIGGAAGAGRGAESRLASIARLTFGHPRFTLIARPRNLRETLLARKAIREALG